jgi:hypothetical protein
MERARRAQPRLWLRPLGYQHRQCPGTTAACPRGLGKRSTRQQQLGLSFIGQPRGVDPRRVS